MNAHDFFSLIISVYIPEHVAKFRNTIHQIISENPGQSYIRKKTSTDAKRKKNPTIFSKRKRD